MVGPQRLMVGPVPQYSYATVQNIQGTKLSRLGYHVTIHRKTFAFASKQHPQVPKNFEICRKTFAVQAKTVKSAKVLALGHFVLYGIWPIYIQSCCEFACSSLISLYCTYIAFCLRWKPFAVLMG